METTIWDNTLGHPIICSPNLIMEFIHQVGLLGHALRQELHIHLSLQYFNGVQVACPLWVKIDDISRL
jgi:hypothetical protein